MMRKRTRVAGPSEGDAVTDAAETWEARGRACGEVQPSSTVRQLVQQLAAWRGEWASDEVGGRWEIMIWLEREA